MADDLNQGPYDGPYQYMDDSLQIAKRLGNFLSPPQQQADTAAATPAKQPSPAAVTRSGAPSTPQTGLPPGQHWESVTPATTPAATPQDGGASGAPSNWSDLMRANKAKLQQDQGEQQRLQTTGPGVNQIKNRFVRGIAKVGDVAGNIVPGIAAAIPGTTQHNLLLQGQAGGRVAQDEKALQNTTQMEDREAQAQERVAQGNRQQAQAGSYAPVTLSPEQASAVGHPELAGEQLSQRAFAQMISAKGHTDAATTGANARTTSAQTAADARTTAATTAADARTGAAQISADAKRFGHAARVTGGSGPNEDKRQPMIDEATAQVQKLNDYAFDPNSNDGRGGFYDPSNANKVYTPEEFTDMKNQISTKLDSQLAKAKLRPLGVRFGVKATTPGVTPDGSLAPPGGAQTAPKAPAQTAPSTAPQPPAVPKEQMVEGRTGTDAQGNKWKVVGGQMKLIPKGKA